MYLQLDFPDDGPAINSLLTTDFGLFVSERRITVRLSELFISVDKLCGMLSSLPSSPFRVSADSHPIDYKDLNADDHAGVTLLCDDLFRVNQPPAEYEAAGMPACPFYLPPTDAVHIKAAPKSPIGTAANCWLLSRSAVRVFQSYAGGTVLPLYKYGDLSKTHSAWLPGETRHVLEPLTTSNKQNECLTCPTRYDPSPDCAIYCGPEELPDLAIEESAFEHHASSHQVFVSIDYLPEFHKRFRSMIGLQPVYRASHEYVKSVKQILSVLPDRGESTNLKSK